MSRAAMARPGFAAQASRLLEARILSPGPLATPQLNPKRLFWPCEFSCTTLQFMITAQEEIPAPEVPALLPMEFPRPGAENARPLWASLRLNPKRCFLCLELSCARRRPNGREDIPAAEVPLGPPFRTSSGPPPVESPRLGAEAARPPSAILLGETLRDVFGHCLARCRSQTGRSPAQPTTPTAEGPKAPRRPPLEFPAPEVCSTYFVAIQLCGTHTSSELIGV